MKRCCVGQKLGVQSRTVHGDYSMANIASHDAKTSSGCRLEFDLTRRDLSMWSTEAQEWVLQRREYAMFVAASVSDVRLERKLEIV